MRNKIIIIAEAGVNHIGDVELAKKLIDVADNAGAEFEKANETVARKSLYLSGGVCKGGKMLCESPTEKRFVDEILPMEIDKVTLCQALRDLNVGEKLS